jgi:ketosteroid isomerase-like protein
MSAAYERNAALARSFIDASNRRDLDDFVAVLSENIELRTPRGIRRGRLEAEQWFTKPFDHLDMHVEEGRLLVTESDVVWFGHLAFTWKESGELAERVEGAAVWQVEDGVIRSWEPFDTATEALRAIGVLSALD